MIYEYEVLGADGQPTRVIEVQQKLNDPALTHDPVSGEPVRRILSRTFAHGSRGTASAAPAFAGCGSGACGLPSAGCGGGSCDWN